MLTFHIFQFLLITAILKIVSVASEPVNRRGFKVCNVIYIAGIFLDWVSTERYLASSPLLP